MRIIAIVRGINIAFEDERNGAPIFEYAVSGEYWFLLWQYELESANLNMD